MSGDQTDASPPTAIETRGTRRPVHRAKVMEIATSIEDTGRLSPVALTPQGIMIAVLLRFEAFQTLGIEEIPALDAIVPISAAARVRGWKDRAAAPTWQPPSGKALLAAAATLKAELAEREEAVAEVGDDRHQ